MIRLTLLCVWLANTAAAQDQAVIDVTIIRSLPQFDLAKTMPDEITRAIAISEDRTYFDSFPATSVITRSVARQFGSPQRRILEGAVFELQMSIALANEFSAEEIMSLFAQNIYLGARCFGFEDALAHRYDTKLEDVTLAQALTLASLIKAPTLYQHDRARLTQRFEILAQQGAEVQFWTQMTADELISAGPSLFLPDSDCPARD